MRTLLIPIIALLMACGEPLPKTEQPQDQTDVTDLYSLTAVDIHGKPFSFGSLRGKKVLIVNTASECGNTPQYAQLQELHETYQDKGLVIVGFPSNDFGGQEPGSEAEIETFCRQNYGVTFPLMSKVRTKGAEQHPVYQWLTRKALNGVQDAEVGWNFHKFLIDTEGHLVKDVSSEVSPLDEQVMTWLQR
ncbi:MAG: glutathione peroxidase [Flavobacteriales bacterium]|nr:glutathione peroxidase [Flavobacteriales bacterium]